MFRTSVLQKAGKTRSPTGTP